MSSHLPKVSELDALELRRIITLERVTGLTTLSADSLNSAPRRQACNSARAAKACAWATLSPSAPPRRRPET